jgi:hypothetical protein
MEPRLTQLNENEILLYLGYRGQELTPELEAQLAEGQSQILAAAQPRLTWKRVTVEGSNLPQCLLELEGEDIKTHLAGCREGILMAATLGSRVDQLIRLAQVRDMSQAVILDACASVAIENVCNNLEEDLRQMVTQEGKYLTDRFSPGYGDMPIAQQQAVCRVLDTGRRIGLTVSGRNLLTPLKSVTAVMGISETPVTRRSRGCEQCRMFRTCQFRKEGTHCGT